MGRLHAPFGSALVVIVLACTAPLAGMARANPDTGYDSRLPAVKVRTVAEGSAAGNAGLLAGDILVSWRALPLDGSSPGETGTVECVLDVALITMEQIRRGDVVLGVLRGGEALDVPLPVDGAGFSFGMDLDPATEALADQGLALMKAGDSRKAIAMIEARVRGWTAEGNSRVAAGFLYQMAGAALDAGAGEPAVELLRRALKMAKQDGAPTDRAVLAVKLAATLWIAGHLEDARSAYEDAIPLVEAVLPGGPLDVKVHINLFDVCQALGQMEPALKSGDRALALWGQLKTARMGLTGTLNNVAIAHYYQGDYARAESGWTVLLDEIEQKDPANPKRVVFHLNLSTVAFYRGNLAEAERHTLAAAANLEQQGNPNPEWLIGAYSMLAYLATAQFDSGRAEVYARKALAVAEASPEDPGSLASRLNDLGYTVLGQPGRESEALALFEQAHALHEQTNPWTVDAASTLIALAETSLAQECPGEALAWCRRADEILEDAAPDANLLAASAYVAAGEACRRMGRQAEAAWWWRRVIENAERHSAHEPMAAIALHGLAEAERSAGRPAAALPLMKRAVDMLEAQHRVLGGTDLGRAKFSDRYGEIDAAYVDLLVTSGRGPEAYEAWERSRARSLRELLAQRDLIFDADIPEALDRRRRQLNMRRERAEELVRTLESGSDAPALQAAREEMESVETGLRLLWDEIRSVSPRLADLHYPEPPDLSRVWALLSEGTVVLGYSLGRERSTLFILGPSAGQFRTATIPAGLEQVRDLVNVLRESVMRGDSGVADADRLASLLLGPAGPELARARSVVIMPDGPLHHVPFSMLPCAACGQGAGVSLGEFAPIRSVASMGVYGQLVERPRSPKTHQAVVFGGADYHGHLSDPMRTFLAERSLKLGPLPGTYREVRTVASAFPGTQTYLGAEATEERVKALGKDVCILHIGAHTFVDESQPLLSAVVLSLPEQDGAGHDDGFLHAWEIFDQVRLDADLVVLSACETGGGAALSGEGIVGLSRAFQYAGARAMLVTLWPVSDTASSRFMEHFYRALQSGAAADLALAQAQAALRKDPLFAAPVMWAPYVLIGAPSEVPAGAPGMT